jgi:hypothetical protein
LRSVGDDAPHKKSSCHVLTLFNLICTIKAASKISLTSPDISLWAIKVKFANSIKKLLRIDDLDRLPMSHHIMLEAKYILERVQSPRLNNFYLCKIKAC